MSGSSGSGSASFLASYLERVEKALVSAHSEANATIVDVHRVSGALEQAWERHRATVSELRRISRDCLRLAEIENAHGATLLVRVSTELINAATELRETWRDEMRAIARTCDQLIGTSHADDRTDLPI